MISEADLQSTFLTTLLLFVAGAQVVHAQAPTRTGSSTFNFTVDATGCPTSKIVNTRFLFAGSDSAGLVLRERTTVTKCFSAEGVDSRILVEAWPATAALNATPRFVLNAFGIAGELVDYHWYRVHQLGCSLVFRTTFPRRDAGPDLLDPIPNEGVSIILVLSSALGRSPDRMRIEVPITNGVPDLERASLPSGFTIRWGDARP